MSKGKRDGILNEFGLSERNVGKELLLCAVLKLVSATNEVERK